MSDSNMNPQQDDLANLTSQVASSYVDDYMPPAQHASAPAPMLHVEPPMVQTHAEPPMTMPAAPAPSATAPQTSQANDKVSQALEDQNIFHLLGVQDSTDDEKEAFLDELQQVIWEDFLENDVDLLLTEDELVEFKKIADKQGSEEEERQSEMIDYLEKLIPDLEKIMLEKALDLKREMMIERIKELLDVYKDQPDSLRKVQAAQDLVDDDQWRAAADELNSIQI